MKNLNVLIVEENERTGNELKGMLKSLDHHVVGQAKNAVEAMEMIDEHDPEFLIINICVNDKHDGIYLGSKLKDCYHIPYIFTSSDPDDTELIQKAILEKPFGFVLKPYDAKDIDTAMQIALAQFEEVNRLEQDLRQQTANKVSSIFLKVNSRLVNINLSDILWIECKGDYAVFKTEDQSFIIHSTMKNIEQKLSSSQFLKVHRSFIINLDKIVDIEDSNLVISDRVIPISRNNKESLFNSINML
jgi:DNA-binding LytR/AlgR family response regulator